jgi:hypothetical protein
MKTVVVRFLCVLMCILGFARISHAQGCRVDYTAHYDMYVTETTDGTNIYTTVLTDGSTSGDPSAGCNESSAKHTASSYNLLGSTGGWLSQTPGCMTCYLTIQNDQQMAGTPGVDYNFQAWAQVECSVFGVFFSNGLSGVITVGISDTFGKNTLGSQTIAGVTFCNYSVNCTVGTTPTCGDPSYSQQLQKILPKPQTSCPYYVITGWEWIKVDGEIVSAIGCTGNSSVAPGGGPCS